MMGKSSLRTAPSRPPSPNYPFKLFPGHLGLFLILISAEFCNSDFNVVIPEICQLRPNVPLNLTWIQEMVHLGIRDEANRVSINILRSEGTEIWKVSNRIHIYTEDGNMRQVLYKKLSGSHYHSRNL